MHIPEIVAPGGSYNKVIVACEYGADAVYLGVPYTSLRMRQNKIINFDDLTKSIQHIHALGKKAYLTMNIFPRNTDIRLIEEGIEMISNIGADAIIFSDLGVFQIMKKYGIHTKLHLSTQANTLNYAAIQFWQDLGINRIILARELHLSEIREIRKLVPNIELEVFVHGAMCMSYSGRCILGEYFAGRESNKGDCPHVCRYNYQIYLEEKKRPGTYIPIQENAEGTYILSSKDLCTIERIGEIIPYVDSIKIEGRSKSEFYVAATVLSYRHILDSIQSDQPINPALKNLIYQIPHREYWEGFLFHTQEEFPEKENKSINNNNFINSFSYKNPGPIITMQYQGLVLPDTIEYLGKIYHGFIPKSYLSKNKEYSYISKNKSGKITILEIINTSLQPIENATCNTEKVYILFSEMMNGWEILII